MMMIRSLGLSSAASTGRAGRHASAMTPIAKSAAARVHTLPALQLQHVVWSSCIRRQHYVGSRFSVLSSSSSSSSSSFVSASRCHRLLSSSSSTATTSSTTSIAVIRWWHPVLGGLLITTAGGISYFYNFVGGSTEGLWRSLSFYSYAIPKYIQYRYHVWKDSSDDEWDTLNRDTSSGALEKILSLQGFYIKAGQFCASNLGDAFPKIWQTTMSVLQDQVPPQPFHIIRDIVASELDFEGTFASFEADPIGSASIGQVHRATLKDGTPVVVKVRYPDVERLLRGDVRTIKLFAQVAQPVHVPGLEEIEKQFQTEFDYKQEADQLLIAHDNLVKAGLAGPGKLCRIPKPYMQYCTKRVLVMEELFGEKLAVELKNDIEHHAARQGVSAQEYVALQLSKFEEEERRTGKEAIGPSAESYRLFIALADGQRQAHNAWARLYNMTVGWLPGKTARRYVSKRDLPLNHAQLVDDLIYVHGHEVLVDGHFNGDPHPGNILLCRDPKDGTPHLGLIDYGQVKRLTKEQRHLFCRLLIALDDENREEVVRLMKIAGFKSQHMDPEVIYLYAKAGYDQDNKELTKGMHIQMFMEELERRDRILQLPYDYITVARASLILRGLCHALHQSRSMAKCWRPIAERVLREDI